MQRLRHALHDLRARRVGAPDGHEERRHVARSSIARSSPTGLSKALTRRPVADDAAAKAAEEIEAALRSRGVVEVPSGLIGEMAMDKLRELDQIAYIRFASVYQSFEDLEQLQREVDTLLAEREEIEREVEPSRPRRRQRRRQALPQAVSHKPHRRP